MTDTYTVNFHRSLWMFDTDNLQLRDAEFSSRKTARDRMTSLFYPLLNESFAGTYISFLRQLPRRRAFARRR